MYIGELEDDSEALFSEVFLQIDLPSSRMIPPLVLRNVLWLREPEKSISFDPVIVFFLRAGS